MTIADDPSSKLLFTVQTPAAADLATLDSGKIPTSLVPLFQQAGDPLSTAATEQYLAKGKMWLIQDATSQGNYLLQIAVDGSLPVYSISASTANVYITNARTANGFAGLQIITAACHGIMNTVFIAPSPKPTWFDDLSSKLDAAKVLAKQWIDDLAPRMTASVPNHVIDYATTYTALTNEIIKLVDADPNAQGKDNPTVVKVAAIIQGLQGSVGDIVTDVDGMQNDLKTWGDKMQKAHDDLYNGAANIQASEADLSADIGKMNSAIKGLQAQIDSENKAIAFSAIGIAVGLLALVVGIALAPETGGASLIVAGIGAAAVIGGAVTWGIMQAKINAQFDEIAKDQKRLTDDQRQLTALQGLSTAANSTVNSIATATLVLSDVRTMWAIFQGELDGTLDKLNKGEQSISAIMQEVWIQAAQDEWNLALAFATSLAGVTLQVQSKTLPMSSAA